MWCASNDLCLHKCLPYNDVYFFRLTNMSGENSKHLCCMQCDDKRNSQIDLSSHVNPKKVCKPFTGYIQTSPNLSKNWSKFLRKSGQWRLATIDTAMLFFHYRLPLLHTRCALLQTHYFTIFPVGFWCRLMLWRKNKRRHVFKFRATERTTRMMGTVIIRFRCAGISFN